MEKSEKPKELTLLDHYALAALSGVCADSDTEWQNHDKMAEWCFDVADAMIEKRKEYM